METDPSAFVVVVVTLFVPLLLDTAPTASLRAVSEIGFTASTARP
jgi:hypothetical protein